MMRYPLTAGLLIVAGLPAQIVTSTITALTPITTHVVAGGLTAQNSMVAGALPGAGYFEASAHFGGAAPFAGVGWFTDPNTASQQRVAIVHQLDTEGLGIATASVAPNEVLVHFAAATNVSIELELRRWSSFSIGAPMPQVAVDLGNDGVIDWLNLPIITPQFRSAVIGPAGYDVRLIMSSTVQGPGSSATSVDIVAHADNALDIALEVAGCAPLTGPAPYQFAPIEVFADRGVDLLMDGQFLPNVLVLGLGLQPVLLPSSFGSACLLLPSPDVVVAIPSGAGTLLHVPLPAAVRPVTLRSQGVGLLPTGLATTDGYRIRAF